MKCLENIIGLRGVCDEHDGNLYINDLPNVSLKKFSTSANEEDVTGAEHFKTLHREAALQVSNDVLYKLDQKGGVEFKDIVSTDYSGEWKNYETEFYDREDLFIGRDFRLNYSDPYVKIRVDEIEVYVMDDVRKIIHIKVDERHIEKEVMLWRGINKIPIDETGKYIRIFFNICNVNIAKKYSCLCSALDSCQKCSCKCFFTDNIEREKSGSWEPSDKLAFKACVSCVCDRSELLCKYKDVLKYALRWKIAALLMEDVIYSDRKNPLVRNSKENAEKYLVKIMGGEDPQTGFEVKNPEYWKAINQAVKNINNTSLKTSCLICTGRRYEETIP